MDSRMELAVDQLWHADADKRRDCLTLLGHYRESKNQQLLVFIL